MRSRIGSKKLFALCAVCPALLALAAALISSKAYWGYFFARPGLNHRIVSAPFYSSLTVFNSLPPQGLTVTSLVRDKESPPEKVLASVREDP